MVLSMSVLAVIYLDRTTVSFSELFGASLAISTASIVLRHLIPLKLHSSKS